MAAHHWTDEKDRALAAAFAAIDAAIGDSTRNFTWHLRSKAKGPSAAFDFSGVQARRAEEEDAYWGGSR